MPVPASGGFPRAARLLRPRDFQRVFQKPFRSTDACFTILARPNGTSDARLGLAIAKKQVRRAVARNRIKRLVRESFRLNRLNMPGLDIVVIGRQRLEKKSNRQLRESLCTHWTRLVGQCARS